MVPDPAITQLLQRWSEGDREALDTVTRLVYDHLRQIAARHMRRENVNHTLSPTAVVHEAYLRLSEYGMTMQSRAHFLSIAAREMRRVLVDHARRRDSQKRGGEDRQKVTLTESGAVDQAEAVDILAVQEAMERLAELDPRKADLVDLIAFGGLTTTEAAEALNVSVATVNRDWRFARAFLQNQLKPERT